MPKAAPDGLLYRGDCLLVVPTLVRRPEDAFDLVYVDPPFNTGVAHRAREARGARARGARAYEDSWGGIERFVAMLEPRLAVLRDALSARGSLWLHLDHRACTKPSWSPIASFRAVASWARSSGYQATARDGAAPRR